jgi:hypothetical protein
MALSLNVALNSLTTNIARCREKVGMGPESRKLPQMSKLLTEHTPGSYFEQPGNVRGKRGGIGPHKQVNMIELNRQFDKLPTVFSDHLSDHLF